MRVQRYHYGVPIQKYYFEHTTKPRWRDVLMPTAYMDCYAPDKPAGFFTEYRHTLLTDLREDEAAIFQNFPKDTRNQIRRCEQAQRFKFNFNTALTEFVTLYNAFAVARGLSLFDDQDARAIGKENYRIFSVEHADRPVICHFYLLSPLQQGVTNLMISASSQAYNHDPDMRRAMGFANRYLHWQGMRYFKSAGFHTYDWGGYALHTSDPVMQGINRFKRTFNGQLTPIYNYYSPFYAFIEKLRHSLRKSRT